MSYRAPEQISNRAILKAQKKPAFENAYKKERPRNTFMTKNNSCNPYATDYDADAFSRHLSVLLQNVQDTPYDPEMQMGGVMIDDVEVGMTAFDYALTPLGAQYNFEDEQQYLVPPSLLTNPQASELAGNPYQQ